MTTTYFDYLPEQKDKLERVLKYHNLESEITSYRKSYLENPRAALVGSRVLAEKIINVIAEKNNIQGSSFEKINQLSSKGKISKKFTESFHKIRKVGNDAAHGEIVTVEQALESLILLDEILRVISGNKKTSMPTNKDEMLIVAYDSFDRKIIYVQTGDNSDNNWPWYEGKEKIGDASVPDNFEADFSPNSPYLRESADKRIRQYMGTAGVPHKLEWVELAYIKSKRQWFRDHQVHELLKRSNYKAEVRGKDESGRPLEWFEIDVETAKEAIKAVKEGKTALDSTAKQTVTDEIVFRPEQLAAIKQTQEVFKKKDEMLWNAKMRFGKTLSALQLVKEQGFEKVLILTHRPVVNDGWFTDFGKIFKSEDNYAYGSKEKGKKLSELQSNGKSFVYFASMQDIRGSEWAGGKAGDKNQEFLEIAWDFVIFDEAHEGTMTELAENVKNGIQREHTKFLELSGTPFNLFDKYDEDNVFTWDYVMEQVAKQKWEIEHPNELNPYESLPKVSMFTFDVGNKFNFQNENKAFNFKEFFRVNEEGKLKYHKDVRAFLDYITKENSETNFPFSTEQFRNELRHTLWLMPGVAEANAFAKLLEEHKVFNDYQIVNVVEDGDSEDSNQSDLKKVKSAIGKDPSKTKTITLTVRKLTTGVNVPEWTGVVFLSNTESPTTYLQAAFRAQTPFSHETLGMKKQCYVFDFAPDRALKIISQSIGLTSKAGKINSEEQKEKMAEMLNFLPILGQSGNQMRTFNVDRMMTHLKRAYAEKAMNSGFEDTSIYNDKLLLQMTEEQIALLNDVKKIVKNTGYTQPKKEFVVNENGLNSIEEYEAGAKKQKKKARELTEEEKKLKEEAKKAKDQRTNAIKVLRAVSVRIPMMIYGMDKEVDEEITIQEFIQQVDEVSWEEFMPKGMTKDKFKELSVFYDEDVFVEAGKMIRARAKSFDVLDPLDRTQKIGELFATFKNPDKETVLTSWRVVNLHCCTTLGGYTTYDETYQHTTVEGVDVREFRKTDITDEVYQSNQTFLEPNAKTGLYPLFVATSLYYVAQEKIVEEKAGKIEPIDLKNLWQDILKENIYVIAKTPMAKRIAERTLSGFKGYKTNVTYIPKLIQSLRNNMKETIAIIQEEFGKVKFDVVVGNPPYQENDNGSRDDGSANASASPLYHHFVELSEKISDKQTLIMPAKWMSGAGKGLSAFSSRMLADHSVKSMNVFLKSQDVFTGVDIKGGVCYYVRDSSYNGKATIYVKSIDSEESSFRYLKDEIANVFIPFGTLATILEKVNANAHLKKANFQKIVSVLKPYGLRTDFLKNQGKYNLPLVANAREAADDIAIHGLVQGNNRVIKYVPHDYPFTQATGFNDTQKEEFEQSLDKWKVFVPKANGSGSLGETFGTPIIGTPNTICTENFIRIGIFDNEVEAKNCEKYIRSKFLRVLVGILKTTPDNAPRVWANVPLQNFTSNSDVPWDKPISEIDQYLYKKYNLSEEEIAFIEEKVKSME